MRTALQIAVVLLLSVVAFGQTPINFSASKSTPTASDPIGPTEATKPAKTGYDPLLDLPPLPPSKLSLIGGTVIKYDPVMDRISLRPFGEKRQMLIQFDVRTHLYQGGQPAAQQDIKPGERIYAETMLDGTKIFAKTIRIAGTAASGTMHGQIEEFDPASNLLTLRDELSQQPVHLRIPPNVTVRKNGGAGSTADLQPGSLVSVAFASQQAGATVNEITLLAQPGSTFSFYGKITYLDLSRKLIAVSNQSDGKTYELQLASVPRSMTQKLREGALVEISAVFDGKNYITRSLSFGPSATSEPTPNP